MSIGITGGTGFIGSHMAEYLVSRGRQVDCLVRSKNTPGWLEESDRLTLSEGDLLRPESLQNFVERNDVIIHLAGKTRAKSEADFINLNFQSTKNLLEAAGLRETAVKQIIIISSQAAVGPSPDGVLLTEDAPLKPISPYGRSKALIESHIKEKHSNLPVTIVRPPSVYGERDKDFLELIRIVSRGLKPSIGRKSSVSFVYVKNLVHGIGLCVENEKAIGETFFFTDDSCYSWEEFGGFVANALEKKALNVIIPKFTVTAASLFSRMYAGVTGKNVLLTKDKLKEMTTPFWTVSSEKAKSILGYEPRMNTEKAVAETVEWYKKNSWI
ncbi:MAG: NAD(P)-dependent oxidoreductase [Spirochaetales bacterium]|uniref:NAD(P)-dependent oxidoreductase n=1 Tax=Candidatus Thalassospirochaeta sargassi TaxID=3119039 RepID=A0AAJ1MKM7_9SPIO|nr:NAD(P)-dependent oxidoreductase [Spirochaetales bacterium]